MTGTHFDVHTRKPYAKKTTTTTIFTRVSGESGQLLAVLLSNSSFSSSTSHSFLAREGGYLQWLHSQPYRLERGIFDMTVVFTLNKKVHLRPAFCLVLQHLWLPGHFTGGQNLPWITSQVTKKINRIENNRSFEKKPKSLRGLTRWLTAYDNLRGLSRNRPQAGSVDDTEFALLYDLQG